MKTLTKWIAIVAIMIAFVTINFKTNAQSAMLTSVETEKWTSVKSMNNVEFFYFVETCNSTPTLFLKIDNKSNVEVDVVWSLWNNTELKSVTVGPGQIRKASCLNSQDEILVNLIPAGQAEEPVFPILTISSK